MNAATHQSATPTSSLLHLFSSMRPSERKALKVYCESRPDVFLGELDKYLELWANSKWLEEYNVERVSKWVGKNCPATLTESARSIAQAKMTRRMSANDNPSGCEFTSHPSIYARTYQVFLTGLETYSR